MAHTPRPTYSPQWPAASIRGHRRGDELREAIGVPGSFGIAHEGLAATIDDDRTLAVWPAGMKPEVSLRDGSDFGHASLRSVMPADNIDHESK